MNPQHQQKRKIRQSYRHKFYPQPLFIVFFNFLHKRPTFAFTSESGHTLGSRRKIAHSGSHAETRAFRMGGGITTLGAFHTFRKPCVAGYQNGKLCRFWALVGGALEEYRKPSEQRCAYACRCPEGVAAPLGCVALLPLFVQHDLLGWKDLTKRSGRVTITRNYRAGSRLALVQRLRWAVK